MHTDMRLLSCYSAALLGLLAGCALRANPPRTASMAFNDEVRRVLGTEQPSPRFYRERERLERMGVELDAVLVALAEDGDGDLAVRRNSLALLGERGHPVALGVIRRVLLHDPDERVRAASIAALHGPGVAGPEARNAIRAAVGDPSRQVRLVVLQALDTEDVGVMRALLAWETDPQVSAIARELVGLAETRGGPLAARRDGGYEGMSRAGEPRLVFHSAGRDPVANVATGALLIETSGGKFVPLAQNVEVVAGVLPAFLATDRPIAVWESERVIHLLDLKTGESRSLGPGVAPRLLPFTERAVWVREVPGKRRAVNGGTEIGYEVWSAPLTEGEPSRLGELRVTTSPERHGNASPVRWMVIGETPEGFVLRGPGIATPFALPNPFAGSHPGRSGAPGRLKPTGDNS